MGVMFMATVPLSSSHFRSADNLLQSTLLHKRNQMLFSAR
jgi:hypothetical protein